MARIVKALIEQEEKVPLVVQGFGVVMARIERLDQDVVTIQPDDHPRMVVHLHNVMSQRD